jgi:BirA family biotin operon repressor/biotin-[acetyl-CoA-carboxylase] ligase
LGQYCGAWIEIKYSSHFVYLPFFYRLNINFFPYKFSHKYHKKQTCLNFNPDISFLNRLIFSPVSSFFNKFITTLHAGDKVRILTYDHVTSTNDLLKDWLMLNAQPYLVVTAIKQSNGRGRLGRKWIDSQGESLLFSFNVQDHPKSYQFGLVAATALCQTLQNHLINARIKWPNDIYINNKKAAGILLEKIANQIIIGIGINVNQTSFPEDIREIATSLQLATSKTYSLPDLLEQFLHSFKSNYSQWQANWQAFNLNTVSHHLCWIGKQIEVQFPNHTLQGKFLGITEEGFLKILNSNQIQIIHSGDFKLCLLE